MGSYNVIQDFLGKSQDDQVEDPDLISVSPYWILAICQMKHPSTFNRDNGRSFTNTMTDGVETRGLLLITSDCQSVSVTSTKSNHVTTLEATLLPGGCRYINEIFPGDYVFCWMMNDEATYLKVLDSLDSGSAANDFMDGLKFVGQCQTMRKVLSVSPDGTKTVRYPLSAAGFTPFDSQLYYDPALAEEFPALGQLFARYGADLTGLILDDGAGIDVNVAIPAFLELLLGKGVVPNFGRGNSTPSLQATTGLTSTDAAPYAYIVPKLVGSILGKTNESKPGGALSYADTLTVITGVQTYNDYSSFTALGPQAVFLPDHTHGGLDKMVKYTSIPMVGTFVPQAPQFSNHPVWSVLNQYLNPAINEMYTTLRVNEENKVLPMLIVRQLPFSSQLYSGSLTVTDFLSVPRWVIHPALIRGQVDLGRTDSQRFNFVHVYGELPGARGGLELPKQVVTFPPPRDELDIARNGVRGFFMTVPCAPADTRGTGPGDWMDLLSDILMGQHMTLSGNISTIGIQAPICIGDNAEFDGVVLHIETVTHTCSMSGSAKAFSTTLHVTHGMRANPQGGDVGLYAGTQHDDQATFDPGITREDKLPAQDLNDIGKQKGSRN